MTTRESHNHVVTWWPDSDSPNSFSAAKATTDNHRQFLPYDFEWQFTQVPHRPPSQTGPTQTPRALPSPVNCTTMWLPSGLTAAGRVPLAPRGQHLPIHPQPWTPMAQYMMSKSSISSGSPQPMPQDNRPRIIASSRRVKKDHSGSNQSKKASQSQHQQWHPWHPLPGPSMSPPILSNASSSSNKPRIIASSRRVKKDHSESNQLKKASHSQHQQWHQWHPLPGPSMSPPILNNINSYPPEERENNYTRQELQHTAIQDIEILQHINTTILNLETEISRQRATAQKLLDKFSSRPSTHQLYEYLVDLHNQRRKRE